MNEQKQEQHPKPKKTLAEKLPELQKQAAATLAKYERRIQAELAHWY